MRALKFFGLGVAIVVAAALLLLATGIPGGFVTSAIQARVERETGYRIEVRGPTRIGFRPSPAVTMQDVAVRDPLAREASDRMTFGSVEAVLSLQDLLAGEPRVTELIVNRPVIRVPLLRDRTPAADAAPKPASGEPAKPAPSFAVDSIGIVDGAVVLFDPRDRVEDRIEGIGATITIAPDRRIHAVGNARLGAQPVRFDIEATAPATRERQTVPVQLTLNAPTLLDRPLAANADVRLNGTVLMINSLTGTLGDGQFNGWASVDFASKPLVKLDLDFQKLDLGKVAQKRIDGAGAPQGRAWSDETISIGGLNYADAQIRLSAAQMNVGDARFAPVTIDAALAGGVLKAAFTKLGVYGGTADGDLSIDVSTKSPGYSLRADLDGVRALPLLSGLADFDSIDGRLQAKIGVRANGGSQRAIISNLAGTAFLNVQDGEIRGVNLARMIRSLTSGTLTGWQDDGRAQSTDLSQLGASFRIENGQATTGDLALAGPLVRLTGAGTVDLASKSLALRVEPKLVMTIQGQGGVADPVGLGIPVMVQGPWAEPRFYPDVAGILDDPDAAYSRLREMGKGLFGTAPDARSGNLGGSLNGGLGETLGTLIQQGLGAARSTARPGTPTPETQPPPPAADGPSPMNDIMKRLFGR